MEYKIPPWKHQLQAIERFKNATECGLLFEQGTGKTPTAINLCRHKYLQNERILSTFVMCPLTVVENWKREFLKHSYLKETDILCLKGSQQARIHDLDRYTAKGKPFVCITNFESLNMLVLLSRLEKWSPEIAIIDESQKIKNISAKRTKHALLFAPRAKFRCILSGTPIVDDLFDIFSQFLFLDNGETFGRDYHDFRKRFFVDWNADMPKVNWFPDYRPREGAIQAINALIYQKSMRVRKKDCLDLPPLVTQEIRFTLDLDQQGAYTALLRDGLTYLIDGTHTGGAVLEGKTPDGEVITADMAIKKCQKLDQIASGFVTDDAGKVRRFKGNPRLKAFEDVISQIPVTEKVIVWANLRECYRQLRELFTAKKIPFVELTGETPAKDKDANIELFCTSPHVRFAIANAASVGVGVNLTAASYAIVYNLGYSWDLDDQLRARNYRGGSEVHKKVTQINIVGENTLDEVKLCALAEKGNLSEAVLKYVREHR